MLPGKPDSYEPDDTPEQAKELHINGTVEQRTLHLPSDVDWLWFRALEGHRYAFQAYAIGGIRPTLAIFAGNTVTPLAPDAAQAWVAGEDVAAWCVAAPAGCAAEMPLLSGRGEVAAPEAVSEEIILTSLLWTAPHSNIYYLRITEKEGLGGLGAFYLLRGVPMHHSLFLPVILAEGRAPATLAALNSLAAGPVAAPVSVRAQRQAPQPAPMPRATALPPGIRALAVGPATRHLYLADDRSLAIYDPVAGRTLARAAIRVGQGGLIADAAADRVLVGSQEPGAVLALDARTLAVRSVAAGFALPGGLAHITAADGIRRVFAADTLAGTVRVLAADDLQTLHEVPVGPGPYAVVASPRTGRVFVALTGSDGVAMLDAATGALLSVTRLGGLGFPQGMALDEATDRLYVVYALSPRYRQIAVLDAVTGEMVEAIAPTLDRPLVAAEALAVDPALRRLLVSAEDGIHAYDLAHRRWLRSPVALHPGAVPAFGLAVDGEQHVAYVASPIGRAAQGGLYALQE